MPTHAGERRGVGAAAKLVSERARSIVRLELQLAAAELKKKVMALGLGIGLLLGAGLFGFFSLALGIGAATAAIALALPAWAALLIMMGGLFGLAGLLALLGIGLLKKGTPPVPEQAIEEARLTTEALKNGKH